MFSCIKAKRDINDITVIGCETTTQPTSRYFTGHVTPKPSNTAARPHPPREPVYHGLHRFLIRLLSTMFNPLAPTCEERDSRIQTATSTVVQRVPKNVRRGQGMSPRENGQQGQRKQTWYIFKIAFMQCQNTAKLVTQRGLRRLNALCTSRRCKANPRKHNRLVKGDASGSWKNSKQEKEVT